jgi:hypothetical protein
MKSRHQKVWDYLTEPNPELAALVKATPPGMAHWAGTGPTEKVCRDCAAWVLVGRVRLCEKYKRMMGKDEWETKKVIPSDTAACKYFEPKPDSNSYRAERKRANQQARETERS